eukprot:EC724483.1.p1 GENE.EC724483.1~~EC724483.1.p1  ORF type:complete len:199 (+),score=29.54 EC724483.1:36-632(+)
MAQYGRKEYWEERYTRDPEPFDWYQRYDGLRTILNQNVQKNSRVLMAGCGSSRLGEDMVADGYADVVNVDFSAVVIGLMQERYKQTRGLGFQVGDVTAMNYAAEFFDAVIDKATLDSMLCIESGVKAVQATINEYARVLKRGGVLIVVTYGQPEQRLSYLERQGTWTVTTHTVPKPPIQPDGAVDEREVHYVYVCRKD